MQQHRTLKYARMRLRFGALLAIAHMVMAVVAAPLHAQELECGGAPTPGVQGVSLGTTLSTVVRVLGTPHGARDLGPDEAMGFTSVQHLSYAGLALTLVQGESDLEPTISELRVSTSSWSFSNGLACGVSESRVLALLGPPQAHLTIAGDPLLWSYYLTDSDGFLLLSFVGGRVTELRLYQDLS